MKPEFEEFLVYEIAGNFWISFLPFNFIHDIIAARIAKKTKRKYDRYIEFLEYERAAK